MIYLNEKRCKHNVFPFRNKPRATEKRYIVPLSPAASRSGGFDIRLWDVQMCLQKLTRRHRGNHKVVSWVVSTVLNCKWTRASSWELKTMTCQFCVGLSMKKVYLNLHECIVEMFVFQISVKIFKVYFFCKE